MSDDNNDFFNLIADEDCRLDNMKGTTRRLTIRFTDEQITSGDTDWRVMGVVEFEGRDGPARLVSAHPGYRKGLSEYIKGGIRFGRYSHLGVHNCTPEDPDFVMHLGDLYKDLYGIVYEVETL